MIVAVCMSVLLGFTAMGTEAAMALMRRLELNSMNSIFRESVLNMNELILNSDKPGSQMAEIVGEVADDNQFEGKIVMEYDEKSEGNPGEYQGRAYQFRITLTEAYECSIMKLFGVKTLQISSTVSGGEVKTARLTEEEEEALDQLEAAEQEEKMRGLLYERAIYIPSNPDTGTFTRASGSTAFTRRPGLEKQFDWSLILN